MRLIDADVLRQKAMDIIHDKKDMKALGIANAINIAPTIDAEPVIRCKDCEYYREAHYEDEGEPLYIKHKCRWTHYRVQGL